jgi:nucleoside-diphosphate-sugar epimerase
MKILVTGSNGFVGKTLVSKLKLLNHQIVEFDLFNGNNILNKREIRKKIKGVDIVFHLAAIINNDNKNLFEINVKGTKNIVECAVSQRVQKFIFLSSTAVYGSTKNIVDENTKLCPVTNYEKSKVDAEKIVLTHQEEININIIRSSMVFGANNYWKGLLKMIKKGFPLPINGKNIFQVIDVNDLCDSLIFIMKKGDAGEIYLVAGQEDLTLNEVYVLIRKIYGLSERVVHIPQTIALFVGKIVNNKLLNRENFRHLSKERKYNISKIKKIGWKPNYKLEDSIKRVIKEFEK